MKTKKNERGQALILIALGAIVLFGFTALAIDSGRAFSDKRHAQGAADNAALSAALARIRTTGNDSVKFAAAADAARKLAASNGYDNNGTTNTVEVNLCSDAGVTCPALPTGAVPSEYIRVKITSTIPTTFARVIRRFSFTSTAIAVVRGSPSTSSSSGGGNGYGITALKKTGTGLSFTGSGDVNIQGGIGDNAGFSKTGRGDVNVSGSVQISGAYNQNAVGNWNVGGNMWVNSLTKTSSTWNIAGDFISNGAFSQFGSTDFNARSFSVVGGESNVRNSGSGHITPWPPINGHLTESPEIQDPFASVLNPPANPSGCITFSNSGGSAHTLNPGCYNSITNTGSGNLTLNPGIYYILGDFEMGGRGDLTANGVMLYMKGGSLYLHGDGALNITPMTSGDYKGLSVYMDRANSNSVKLQGDTSSTFAGTVYAPAGSFEMIGAGGTFVADSQIICGSGALTGSGGLTLNYTGANNYNPTSPTDPVIEFNQ